MQNDRYPPERFDPLESGVVLGGMGWWAMLPTFTSPSQAVGRLVRLEEAQTRAAQALTIAPSPPRSPRLERAGYLLVVYPDRLVRAVAALALRVGRSAMKQVVTRRYLGARPNASATEA